MSNDEVASNCPGIILDHVAIGEDADMFATGIRNTITDAIVSQHGLEVGELLRTNLHKIQRLSNPKMKPLKNSINT